MENFFSRVLYLFLDSPSGSSSVEAGISESCCPELHVHRLISVRSFHQVKGDSVTLLQDPVSLTFDRREVDEDFEFLIDIDEAITAMAAEPLDLTGDPCFNGGIWRAGPANSRKRRIQGTSHLDAPGITCVSKNTHLG